MIRLASGGFKQMQHDYSLKQLQLNLVFSPQEIVAERVEKRDLAKSLEE